MKPASSTSPDSDPQSEQRWIAVARLMRPQGRKGEILTDPLTDLSEVFAKGRVLHIASSPADPESAPAITVEDCWRPQGRNAGRLVLKLTGVDSISDAEALQGKELFLPEAGLPALDADTYLVRDLIGCSLYNGDQILGQVTDLQFPIGPDGHTRLPDAVDLLVVQPPNAAPDNEPTLVPFVKAWLISVDLDAKRITMDLPEGLFEGAEIPGDEATGG